MPTRRCHSLSEGYKATEEMDLLIKRLINLDKERLYIIGSNQIGTVISLSSLLEKETLSYQSVFMIDEQGDHCIPGVTTPRYLSRAILRVSAGAKNWLTMQKLTISLLPERFWNFYGWISTSSKEEEYITQLQFPVQKNF